MINPWTIQQMRLGEAMSSRRMFIKFVRLTWLLPWFCGKFEVSTLFC